MKAVFEYEVQEYELVPKRVLRGTARKVADEIGISLERFYNAQNNGQLILGRYMHIGKRNVKEI